MCRDRFTNNHRPPACPPPSPGPPTKSTETQLLLNHRNIILKQTTFIPVDENSRQEKDSLKDESKYVQNRHNMVCSDRFTGQLLDDVVVRGGGVVHEGDGGGDVRQDGGAALLRRGAERSHTRWGNSSSPKQLFRFARTGRKGEIGLRWVNKRFQNGGVCLFKAK